MILFFSHISYLGLISMYDDFCHHCVSHNTSGTVDGDAPEWSVNLPCRTRPLWLERVMYASESAPERASPSEGLSLEPHSMLSVAVKISSHNTERNVKVSHITGIDKCCFKMST